MKLLMIEDEPQLLARCKTRFQQLGFILDTASTAQQGAWLWQEYPYDLIILDLGLPDQDGLSLLQERRAAGDVTPVLILTARNLWHERVKGLQAGADDYLGKPFHMDELIARVEALIRRNTAQTKPDFLKVGQLTLHLNTRTAQIDDKVVELPPKPFQLLKVLMQHPGQPFSKQQLLDKLYPYDEEPGINTIEVHVHYLRKLLGKHLIKNRRGYGYFIEKNQKT